MPLISRPLTVDNKLVGLPAQERLTGQSVIDTSKPDDRTGMLTSDPVFTSEQLIYFSNRNSKNNILDRPT